MEPAHHHERAGENASLMKRVLGAAFDRPSQIPDGFMAYLVDYLQTTGLRIPVRWLQGLIPIAKLVGYPADAAKVLKGDGTWGAAPGGAPSGAAGGDLSGTYPNPTVAALAITDAKVAAANKDGAAATASMRTLGTGAAQAAAGNDSRLSDSRAPNGAAGGDLSGTYPSPTIAALAVTDAKVAAANKDGTAVTPSLRTIGTGALQAAAGNDSRLSDARTPTGAAGGDLSGTYPNPTIGISVYKHVKDEGSLLTDRDTVNYVGAGVVATDDAVIRKTDVTIDGVPKGAAGGDLAGTYPSPTLATVATAGSAGDALHIPQLTIDAKGRVTALAQIAAGDANGNASAQVASAADTYVTGSPVSLASIKAGTVIKWRISITKTGAGVATPIIQVRVGTAKTTADTSRLSWTLVAQTAIADNGWLEIEVVFQAVGASGVLVGAFHLTHNLATTGFATQQMQVGTLTSGTFDTTVAALFAGLSINPGASGAWTFKTVSAELINPA